MVVVGLSALYICAMASPYLWRPPSDYSFAAQRQTYASFPLIMMLHIGGGIVALLAGTLQFLPWLKRFRRWHRGVGVTYCAAVAIGGVSGIQAAGFAWGGVSNTAAFGLMSTVWLVTTGMAVVSIARCNVRAHQLWMKRSFAVTLAAVTLRIEIGLFIFVGGLSFADTYRIVPWTSWVLNLLVVEWVPWIRRFELPQTSTSVASSSK